ncbi:HAD family hydrolase [Streptomyces sp. NPDC050560]|uniref:HAD family hydrolase n=1 Tax=Streptomyces sp. NPDC050560 TaxID=3365630 RepID=UPI0037B746D6
MTALVASDLDRTLVYSAAALELTGPDRLAPRLLCVETYRGRPLSYLTEIAAGLLTELAARALFVPATTRTREQYERVRLPVPTPDYAICANGGHLLVGGAPDWDWTRAVRARLDGSAVPLAEVTARLAASADPSWLLKQRVAEDFFAYLVVERELLPAGWLEELTGWAAERGWTVSLQGRKVYAVPAGLTKSAAVREVVGRTGAAPLLAAGDSLLDADLLLAADEGLLPGHGELAASGFTAPGVTGLGERGVLAGEEIVRRLFMTAIGHQPSAAQPSRARPPVA